MLKLLRGLGDDLPVDQLGAPRFRMSRGPGEIVVDGERSAQGDGHPANFITPERLLPSEPGTASPSNNLAPKHAREFGKAGETVCVPSAVQTAFFTKSARSLSRCCQNSATCMLFCTLIRFAGE